MKEHADLLSSLDNWMSQYPSYVTQMKPICDTLHFKNPIFMS